jgi:hypothetical protein
MALKYRFLKEEHLHQVLVGEEWKNLYGTTTVLDVISKPLTAWASGMACAQFGWINQKPYKKPAPPKEAVFAAAKVGFDSIKAMSLEGYVAHLDKAYKAYKEDNKTTASAGTQLHAEIETYILYCLKNNGGKPVEISHMDERVNAFALWAQKNVQTFLWAEMNHFSEKLWVGGQSDLGYVDKQEKIVIGDIKSAKDAYFSHFCQAAFYDIQIAENGGFNADGVQTFDLDRLLFGVDRYEVFAMGKPKWEAPDVQTNTGLYKRAALAALELFKVKEIFDGQGA